MAATTTQPKPPSLESRKQFKSSDEFDDEYLRDIERRTNINSCIQCGTCTASCESGRWTALKIRNIIRKVVLGDLSSLDDPDIWLCTPCYQCYERCPRDVRPTDVIIELRNYATKRGNMSPAHQKTVGFLKQTGHGVPIDDKTRKQRVELGLPELPPTIYKYKDEKNSELQKMADHLFNLPAGKNAPAKKKEA